MLIWGITGTNGKTTTTWIAAAFFNACAGRKCGYITTVEVDTTARKFYTGYTTPPLAQLKEIFAEMEANGCTDCVMEMSSHAIHQRRAGDTVFAGGAFTNLSEDHLDYHKTMAAYFDVKLDFARQIAAAHPVRPDMGRRDLPPYVVCLDGGYGREMFEAVGNLAVNVIPVSIKTNASAVQPPTSDLQPGGFDLSKLQLVGDYNKSNVLTAAALAEAAGVPHDVIQRAIPTLKPRWGRLERVENPNVAAEVFVDFAHTPDGLEKVLTAVRGMMQSTSTNDQQRSRFKVKVNNGGCSFIGRRTIPLSTSTSSLDLTPNPQLTTHNPQPTTNNQLWIVFGAGGDRDPMKRPLMGEACARLADRLVVTSDNPRSEEPMEIIRAIIEGIGRARSPSAPQCVVEPDREKAIEFALSNAKQGDVVVVAGKGHETTQEIKGVKHPFDDREVVRNFRNG